MSFLIALIAGVVLTPILGAIGARFGLVDRPGELKIHDAPKPVTGGSAVVAAVLLGVALIGHGDPWIAAAACVALGGGLVDDVRPLPPWVRLIVQTAAGVLLVAGGLRLEPLGELGGISLVIVTIAGCNAVNMVDGQDGLAAGLGTIAALAIAAVLGTTGFGMTLPLTLAGGLLGFLVWNRPPAHVFLGDGGAYAVGVLLVASAAQATAAGWHGLLAAGACLGVFAYELVATIARRLASTTPTVRGDRDHSYDRLGDRVGSRLGATLAMWALGLLTSLVGVAIVHADPLPAAALIVAVTIAAAVLDARLLPVYTTKEDR